MAKPDHTAVAHHDARIPTNPLSRSYWSLAEAAPDQPDTATWPASPPPFALSLAS